MRGWRRPSPARSTFATWPLRAPASWATRLRLCPAAGPPSRPPPSGRPSRSPSAPRPPAPGATRPVGRAPAGPGSGPGSRRALTDVASADAPACVACAMRHRARPRSTDEIDKRVRDLGGMVLPRGRPRGEARRVGCKPPPGGLAHALAGLRRSRAPPLGGRAFHRRSTEALAGLPGLPGEPALLLAQRLRLSGVGRAAPVALPRGPAGPQLHAASLPGDERGGRAHRRSSLVSRRQQSAASRAGASAAT